MVIVNTSAPPPNNYTGLFLLKELYWFRNPEKKVRIVAEENFRFQVLVHKSYYFEPTSAYSNTFQKIY